jgi:hypothetical protein
MVLVGMGTEMVARVMNNGGGAVDNADVTASSSVPHSAALGGAWNGTLPANLSSHLWKSLLKSKQAKSTCSQTYLLPSPSPMSLQKPLPVSMALDDKAAVALSRSQSPAPMPALVPVSTMVVTDPNLAGAEKRQSKWQSFFITWFYTLLQMIEVHGFHLLLHKPWS